MSTGHELGSGGALVEQVEHTTEQQGATEASGTLIKERPERKRGIAWTAAEHRLFLLGLQKLGKGDWRGISRHFVTTRTPTQVASHAQKHYMRQSNVHKRKRRSSLFDMQPDDDEDMETATATARQHLRGGASSQGEFTSPAMHVGQGLCPAEQASLQQGALAQQQLLQALGAGAFMMPNPQAAAAGINTLLACLLAAGNPAVDPTLVHAVMLQNSAAQAAAQAATQHMQQQQAGRAEQGRQALQQQLGMLGPGGLPGFPDLQAMAQAAGLGQYPPAAAASATLAAQQQASQQQLQQQQQQAISQDAAVRSALTQDAAMRNAAAAYSLAQAAAYHAGAPPPASYHALASAAAQRAAVLGAGPRMAEVPPAPAAEGMSEGTGNADPEAAGVATSGVSSAHPQQQEQAGESSSGLASQQQQQLPAAECSEGFRTWHYADPGSMATGEQQQGARLSPETAEKQQPGSADVIAATEQEQGASKVPDPSAAPLATAAAAGSKIVATGQHASFGNGKLVRPIAKHARFSGGGYGSSDLTASSNWSESTRSGLRGGSVGLSAGGGFSRAAASGAATAAAYEPNEEAGKSHFRRVMALTPLEQPWGMAA